MAQHAILRFEKHKGHPAGPLEAHHERKKEQYASNPDIDTSREQVQISTSSSRMAATTISFRAASSRPDAAPARTALGFVDTLITASPEFFKGKSPKEIAAYLQRAADLLGMTGQRENVRLGYGQRG